MNTAHFRFYAELNDFIPEVTRYLTTPYAFRGNPAIKDSLEALGVPHTEVDLILVNGESVNFTYLLKNGDQASVYPAFRSIDIEPVLRLRPDSLPGSRFVIDGHLGRLASYLRMMGFDSLYRNDYEDHELARISRNRGRILLTRDRGLLKRGEVLHGYCVRAIHPYEQLIEVIRRYSLTRLAAPFTLCIRCNGALEDVPKDDIIDRLPTGVREEQDRFRRCQTCDQLYWRGSHYERMRRLIDRVLADVEGV